MKEYIKQKAKSKIKKILWNLIKPILPYIIIVFSLVLIVSLLFTSVNAMIIDRTVDDRISKEDNKKLIDEAIKITESVNNENTFTTDGKRIGYLADYYGTDEDLKLLWGYPLAYIRYKEMINKTDTDIDIKNIYRYNSNLIKEITKKLTPKFIYKTDKIKTIKTIEETKTRKIKTIDDKGNPKEEEEEYTVTYTETEEENIYLLDSAETIKGNYQFKYVIKTYVDDTAYTINSKKKVIKTEKYIPELDYENTIMDENYNKLKQLIIQDNPSESIDDAIAMILNIADGYISGDSTMAWAFNEVESLSEFKSFSNGEVDYSQLGQAFIKASQEYGIPHWFIMAIAFKESRFNPNAINPDSGCFGIMQLQLFNWDRLSRELGYNTTTDKLNPEAQIRAGTKLLKEYIGNVNWSLDWKNQVLSGLKHYGGFKDIERCKREYASGIYNYSDAFSVKKAYPATKNIITSKYGWRIHPITKTKKFHTGIDIEEDLDNPIGAAHDGKVIWAGKKGGYGNLVILQNGILKTYYAHLNKVNVQVGQNVKASQIIGYAGTTGASTGVHLHFETRLKDETIDPLIWFSGENIKLEIYSK